MLGEGPSTRILTVDHAFKLLRRYQDLEEIKQKGGSAQRDASIATCLAALLQQQRFLLSRETDRRMTPRWLVSIPEGFDRSMELTVAVHNKEWSEDKNRKSEVFVYVSVPSGSSKQILFFRDRYGAIGWQKASTTRGQMDVLGELRKTFPGRLPEVNNQETVGFVKEILRRNGADKMRVYRKLSSNASLGFTTVVHWPGLDIGAGSAPVSVSGEKRQRSKSASPGPSKRLETTRTTGINTATQVNMPGPGPLTAARESFDRLRGLIPTSVPYAHAYGEPAASADCWTFRDIHGRRASSVPPSFGRSQRY